MYCTKCGSQVLDGSVACTNCGATMGGVAAAQFASAPYQESAQASYQQPLQQAYQQGSYAAAGSYVETTGVERALAMSVYWGLLPLIFCWVVADEEAGPYVRHHLNQALVLAIGFVISWALSIVVIGFLLGIALFVLTIIGTVEASRGETTGLPLLGKIKILK